MVGRLRRQYDLSRCHAALDQIDGRWYLFAQACGRPANDNYGDGAWEMWCFDCNRKIPTRPGCMDLYISGNAH